MRRAHAVFVAGPGRCAGEDVSAGSRESAAWTALNGPSMRTVPTCGKNV